jgi:hypothetical protein
VRIRRVKADTGHGFAAAVHVGLNCPGIMYLLKFRTFQVDT